MMHCAIECFILVLSIARITTGDNCDICKEKNQKCLGNTSDQYPCTGECSDGYELPLGHAKPTLMGMETITCIPVSTTADLHKNNDASKSAGLWDWIVPVTAGLFVAAILVVNAVLHFCGVSIKDIVAYLQNRCRSLHAPVPASGPGEDPLYQA